MLVLWTTPIVFSQVVDSSGKGKMITEPKGITFPVDEIRLTILGIGVVLLGGLGMILNEKRKSADKRVGL